MAPQTVRSSSRLQAGDTRSTEWRTVWSAVCVLVVMFRLVGPAESGKRGARGGRRPLERAISKGVHLASIIEAPSRGGLRRCPPSTFSPTGWEGSLGRLEVTQSESCLTWRMMGRVA